jgi:tetratricopeptide (TPR) repeat protein
MTTSVVGCVGPKLDQAEMERVKRKPVENLDAYDCFLRGMAKMYEQTRDSYEEALRLFYRSIELDPSFATPYGMAARVYGTRRLNGKVVNRDWEDAETRRLALRVSVIGRDDAMALCWAGQSLAHMCRDYDTGAALIDQGLSINQNLAVGWQLRGLVSMWLGQHEAAIEHIARASRLNPKDPEAFRSENVMSAILLFKGKYDEAVSWVTRALAHQPNWLPALLTSAAANALAGNIDEARNVIVRMRQLEPAISISHFKEILPFRRLEDAARWIDGLRLAGLPE